MRKGEEPDWEEQVALIKANRPRLLEAMAIMVDSYVAYAAQYRKYYDALTAEGFTPEQALEIVKAHGWMPR